MVFMVALVNLFKIHLRTDILMLIRTVEGVNVGPLFRLFCIGIFEIYSFNLDIEFYSKVEIKQASFSGFFCGVLASHSVYLTSLGCLNFAHCNHVKKIECVCNQRLSEVSCLFMFQVFWAFVIFKPQFKAQFALVPFANNRVFVRTAFVRIRTNSQFYF